MAKILCIETAESVCSVCLAVDGVPLFLRESVAGRDHSASLAPFIADIFEEAGITADGLDAIAVSMGPGSYTGLRIGAATAKGLCYAANLKFIAVGTLNSLAQIAGSIAAENNATRICAVIDARRMEIYAAFFDIDGNRLSDAAPVILDEHSFEEELVRHKIIFVGSGAEKCREIIRHSNALFATMSASAKGLAPLAQRYYEMRKFENLISFEPFYLKSFAATQAKRGMLKI